MRAALLTGARRVELVERAVAAPARREVRVRIEQCGLCTSEIDLWLGKDPSKFPAAIGHEIAGTVEEVGDEVGELAVGDRVVAWVEDGGFADSAVVQVGHAIKVRPDLPYPAVAEPLACVVNAVELAAPALSDDIVIIGAGYMGSLVQLVTALKGPRTVTVADVRPDALERANNLGATRVVNTSEESLSEAVSEVTNGRGADVCYEVTGTNAGLDLAGEVTRMSGKLCIVGYHQGGLRSVDLARWNWMAFQIVNAHFRSVSTILDGMRTGMRLVDAGVLDVAPLVSHVFALTDLADAFEVAAAKQPGFVKAVVEPNGATGRPAVAP